MTKQFYESIVSESLLHHFPDQRGQSLMNHAFNTCSIEHALALTSVFWPIIVEDEGHVFIADFYTQDLSALQKQFHYDKQKIERWVNAWSIPEFFDRYYWFYPERVNQVSEQEYDLFIHALGESIQMFWSLRLKHLFPKREFVFELDEAIEGENGLTITFYEK